MNIVDKTVWGREFELEIAYDCYEDETVDDSQTQALDSILKSWSVVSNCLGDVKAYCQEHNGDDIPSDGMDNIFRYVIPKTIYIPRDQNTRTVALLCDYRFDIEHGIAIVFEKEKFKTIGPQDLIL